MKSNRIITILAAAIAVLGAVSCEKEIKQKPLYPINQGEEYVNVSTELLEFQGRGGSISFVVDASYDGRLECDGWITLENYSFPGDKHEYVMTATVAANKGDGAKDREGTITIATKSLIRTIKVTQPFYNRPEIPNPIKTTEDFKFFIEEGAVYIEPGETVALASDIDMKGIKLASSAEYFNGILEGNGCSVNNMSGDKPLFDKISEGASVNNLTIKGEYVIGDSANEIYFSPFAGKNYGTIASCRNEASIQFTGEYGAKVYAGGFAAYSYAGSKLTSCVNRGAITYGAASSANNAYIGGVSGYNYGDIDLCENYGPITCSPAAFNAVYFLGGITSRHQTGILTGCIVHKEAKIYTNTFSSSSKSYIGGIVGFVEGAPKTSGNQVYADIEVNLAKESYIGGLQGWQNKVDDASMPNATIFEGCIVNSNITAYTAGKGANGNNPCNSAGFVTGRFSGQSGKATTLHYGTADKPIKVSGSVTCLATGTKLVATAKAYQDLLDGDGSKTSVNKGAIPECDYGNILYEVVGDGQTGPAEDMIVKTETVKLSAPSVGGEVSFTLRGNYEMKVVSENDWLQVYTTGEPSSELSVAGDAQYYEIKVKAVANNHTYDREGKVTISMPMGTTESVTVLQGGNKTLPESLEVTPESITADPAGTEASSIDVTLNYDAVITTDADWIKPEVNTIVGDEETHKVKVSFDKNQSGAARNGNIIITLPKGLGKTVSVSQDKFVYIPKAEIGTAADFLDFMTFGFDEELYPSTFEVRLTADIDLKGKTVGMIPTFSGNFNGQGHCLKNISSDVPLFGINKGIIKNLVLDGSCSFALDPTKAPTSGSAIWTGAICGNSDPGTISGCTNKASVTMTAVPTMQTFIGGIAGRSAKTVTISDCVNEGSIIIKPSAKVEVELRVAGVVAGINGSIQNCINNAPVEYSPADLSGKGFYLGGVAAYITEFPMTGCKNLQKGKVTFDPAAYTGSTQSYVGGLVAFINKKTTISGCRNFGDVKVTANNEKIAAGGLGGWIAAGASGFVCFEDCAVNCNITAVAPADGATSSLNPLKSAGLVLGSKKTSDGVTCTIGSDASPVKVAGSITVNGGATTTLDASNYTNYLLGNGEKSDLYGGSTKFIFKTTYEAVTKE